MHTLFFVCALGAAAVMPVHFLSVEHVKLQRKYGENRGNKIGEICSYVSGWGFFLFWIGMWLTPQPRFTFYFPQNNSFSMPIVGLSTPVFHLAIFVPLFAVGAWLGINGVKETTLKVAETHRPEKTVTTGVYSLVRHPQYLGGFLAHLAISFLLSAWLSLLSTPFMAVLIYFMSRKEEQELSNDFGTTYENYRKKVPMFIPKLRKQNKRVLNHRNVESLKEDQAHVSRHPSMVRTKLHSNQPNEK